MKNILKTLGLVILAGIMIPSSTFAQEYLLESLPSSKTGIYFRNDIVETPEMFFYKFENLYIGSGVAVGDINNDGLQDLYFGSSLGENKLYLNLGNFQFRDITQTAGVVAKNGVKSGVNMVDINNDGLLDIFTCATGYDDPEKRRKHFYINNGDLTFTDRIKELGLDDRSFSTQSYFFDFDLDGDKDLYLQNHLKDFSKSMTIPATMVNGKLVYFEDTTNTKYVSDRLFENLGTSFRDITVRAGLINHTFGLSTAIADVNGDGWPDLYVANDFNKPDFLYINNQDGTFTNKLSEYIKHVSFSAMGTDISDINNDGLEDIFTMDMAVHDPVRQKQLYAVNQNYDKFQLLLQYGLYYQYPRNTLQLNNGNNTYSEIANFAGVAETDWSWSPLFTDFNNDGFKDIYITNGLKRDITDWDYKVFVLDSISRVMQTGKNVDLNKWLQSMPSVPVKNYIFQNNGSLNFRDVSQTWTDAPASFSNGSAYADLDNDGDLDMVVNNVDGEAFILKNNSTKENHYIRFRLLDDKGSFSECYGTTITLTTADNKLQTQHYNPQRGFLSTSEHFVHFGTGKNKVINDIKIVFPGGRELLLKNIKTDTLLTLYKSDGVKPPSIVTTNKTFFTTEKTTPVLSFKHVEDNFIDFKREPLIPYKCSRKGPYFAKADVNADGREDVFIGGAAGEPGALYIQNTLGNYIVRSVPSFVSDKEMEDMGAAFFDADGDGDQDLYVVSGGAAFSKNNILYQDRLYFNDGLGNFTKSLNSLPTETNNGSIVLAFDFDKDGDMDLFVGGHVQPGSFPKYDPSFILQNDKGIFTNVTEQVSPGMKNAGIVTQAEWVDTDKDGNNELWLTGEWMSPKAYNIVNGKFLLQEKKVIISLPNGKDSTLNLSALTGWWYNMKIADADADGDKDIILANRGLNSSIKATVTEPCTVYAKDFDGNGSYDAVIGYYNEHKLYPLFSRDQLIDQIPSMRKKFVRYYMYSGKTLDEIFTPAEKQNMDTFYTRFFESGVLRNEGNNIFRFIPFPDKAQFSNINDMVMQDFTGNGKQDILLCGNSEDPAVMVGVYDATATLLLKNTGSCNFEAVPPTSSGLKQNGEVRRILPLGIVQQRQAFVLLKNNAPAEIIYKTDK